MSATDPQEAAPLPAELTIDDIRAAAERIAGAVVRTRTMHSRTLSEITGAQIWLKFENLQFTAAYKERGALNALLLMDEEQRARGVIAASAGNHAQGLAYHGKRLGVPVTIVMPRTTPMVKVMQTEQVGGKVVLEGETYDEAYGYARSMEKQLGLTFVHPFDEPAVAAGQGTVALEMLEDAPEIDTLAIPIGGGGLLSGMAVAARAINPDIRLVGVQPTLYPSMYGKLRGESLPAGGDTLAEGIAVKVPGEFTSRILAGLGFSTARRHHAEVQRRSCRGMVRITRIGDERVQRKDAFLPEINARCRICEGRPSPAQRIIGVGDPSLRLQLHSPRGKHLAQLQLAL